MPISRGEVEDIRLEAKTKDTKKIRGQGQGQPFRGQALSRPRKEGTLKADDTGASHLGKKIFFRRSQKKKVFKKNFANAGVT